MVTLEDRQENLLPCMQGGRCSMISWLCCGRTRTYMWTSGGLSFGLPRAEFYRYFQQIVEAGFGKRVMFGSDQMVWPGVIERSIQAIESAPFLSETQKRDILYNNAARFLRFSDADIGRHHGR
jgi:predicted TIM-barrel fold metal-dependent hydrolase